MVNKKRNFMIDWMRFTIPMPISTTKNPFVSHKGAVTNRLRLSENPDDILLDVIDVLKLGIDYSRLKEITKNHSFYGYDKQFTVKGVRVQFMDYRKPEYNDDAIKDEDDYDYKHPLTIERDARMGICVELSGSACRSYEYYLSQHDMTIFDVLKRLKFRYPKMKLTRLDLTYDIKKYMPGIRPLSFYRQCSKDLLTTHLRTYKYYGGGKFGVGSTGDTCTVGERKGPFYLRIYDKLRERYYAHGDTWLDIENGFWIRWEMELKHPLSDAVLENVIDRDEGMYGFYLSYLDVLASKIWVNPSKKQLAKHDYQIVPKQVGKRVVKTPMANWWADLINPIDRQNIKVQKLEHPTSIGKVQKLYGSGSLFDKLAIHISKKGDPFKLIAHWVAQGKLKKNDDDFQALVQLINDSHYDPKLIDNCYSDDEAMSIIRNAFDYADSIFDLERQKYIVESTDEAFNRNRGPHDENDE